MFELRAAFLGPPIVTVRGNPIELSPRKVLALFARLAVDAGRLDRDALAQLLYPTLNRERARAGLRQCLSKLCEAIGDEWVGKERNFLWLPDGKGLWIDLREASRLGAGMAEAEKGSDTAALLSKTARAERLFRGEFLSGFFLKDSVEFETWHQEEAHRFRRHHARILERLAVLHEGRGDLEPAISSAEKLLVLDLADEAAHRSLMRLYAAAGRRAEALRQYERCKDVLRRELDAQPDEETEQLRAVIAAGAAGGEAAGEASSFHPAARMEASGHGEAPETPHNLRAPPSQLVGRERELTAICEALRSGASRAVTLTGPGGVGKTRLALEAAWQLLDEFPRGVYFVDLAALRDPIQVVPAIAAAVGMPAAARERRPLLESLEGFLRKKQILLVLDNFEHVLVAAEPVAELVAECPGLKVLVTSRRRLSVRAETEMRVPALRLPEPGLSVEALRRSEAVRLFVQRATRVQSDFAVTKECASAIAEICVRLDGLPLAIELAASRIKAFSPGDLSGMLESRLKTLVDGPSDLPFRQRMLKREIDWSYHLLAVRERRLFRRLAVFPGACTLEAAQAVCGEEGERGLMATREALAGLVDSSMLLRVDEAGRSRFQMLQIMKEYARDRLRESGEAESIQRKLAAHFRDLAERAEPRLYGAEQRTWFAILEGEHANLMAALALAHERGSREDAARLAGALGWFWFRKARFEEGEHWIATILGKLDESDPPLLRAKLWYSLGLLRWTGNMQFRGLSVAVACFDESLRLWREAGDQRGIALSLARLAYFRRVEFLEDGVSIRESPEGTALVDESVAIARQLGEPWTLAFCLLTAYGFFTRKEIGADSRVGFMEEAVALAKSTGDPYLLSQVKLGMGQVYATWSEWDDLDLTPPDRTSPRWESLSAGAHWCHKAEEAAKECEDIYSRLLAMAYRAMCHLRLGEASVSRNLYHDALRIAEDDGVLGMMPTLIGGLDWVARSEKKAVRSARLWGAAMRFGDPSEPFPLGLPQLLRMDPESGLREWTFGHSMSLDEAIAYALSDD
jgi:predicted ATPase/DNA-binding SARP family transcriptional activator